MSNTLFLNGVPDERKNVASYTFRDSRSAKFRKREQENKRAPLFSDSGAHIFVRLSLRHPYYLRAWNRLLKTLFVFFSLKTD